MQLSELTNKNACMGYYDTRSQLARFIYSRAADAFKLGDCMRNAISSVAELEQYRSTMRERFIELLGGLPPCDTPLLPEVTGTVRCDGFRIEKVIFQSRPRCYVTSNMYIPDNIEGPSGAVLFLCGHSEDGKQYPAYQTVCQYLVQEGLVVLAMDPVGQGERHSYHEKSLGRALIEPAVLEHDHAGVQSLLLGDSIARYFIHDAMRAVDYLCSRHEVDPLRIGVTGSSGGGTQTCMMMICDQRIAAAAPTNFLTDRESYMYAGGVQDSEQLWPGYTALGYDHEEFLIGMAPRPVLVNAVKYDFFPVEGTRRTVERAKRFWNIYGKENNILMYEDISGHAYTEKLAGEAAKFFARYLLGGEGAFQRMDIKPLPPHKLYCTSTGQIKGEREDARFIYEENITRTKEICRPEAERAKEWLTERVFYNRKSCELNPRCFPAGNLNELMADRYLWWSQEKLHSHALCFRHFEYLDNELPITIAVWEGGTSALEQHMKWIRKECSAKRAVLVLDVSGTGCLEPYPVNDRNVYDGYGTLRKFSDDLIWLGDSLPAMRTYEVIRTLDVIGQLPVFAKDDTAFYGHERFGIYGQLAGYIDKRIKSIKAGGEAESLEEIVWSRYYNERCIKDVIFPGILKYFKL